MDLADRLKLHLVPAGWHMANLRRRLRRREPELGILPLLVPRGRVAVDAGANKGLYTQPLLRLASAVHAFEANPALIPWVSRFRDPRLTIHQLALGERDGEAVLRVPMGRSGRPSKQGATLSVTQRAPRTAVEMPIPIRRLDSFDLGDVGFIKIDVEGYEAQVVEGARETIARCRPVMLIEIEESHTSAPPSSQIERIVSLGYGCCALADGVLTDWRLVDVGCSGVRNWIFLPQGRH